MDFPFPGAVEVVRQVAELEARLQTAKIRLIDWRENLTAKNGELQLLFKVLDSKDKLHKREIETLHRKAMGVQRSKDVLHTQEMYFTKQKLNITASFPILAVVGAALLFLSSSQRA
jgi:sensor histidine kinase regulating citrate/malate metabolism